MLGLLCGIDVMASMAATDGGTASGECTSLGRREEVLSADFLAFGRVSECLLSLELSRR